MATEIGFQTLTYEDVVAIHHALVVLFQNNDPIAPAGERVGGLLQSAVGRQLTGSNGQWKYTDPVTNAGALTYGLVCNHPFHNGNKRTALVALLVHRDRNHLVFQSRVSHDEVYGFILAMADHKLHELDAAPTNRPLKTRERRARDRRLTGRTRFTADEAVEYTAEWLRERVRPLRKGEKLITYKQLTAILKAHGYELEPPIKNTSAIRRTRTVIDNRWLGLIQRPRTENKVVTTIQNPGMSRQVPIGTIKKVRRDCGLSDLDGVDSYGFYEQQERIDYFLNEYRNILKKLARR